MAARREAEIRTVARWSNEEIRDYLRLVHERRGKDVAMELRRKVWEYQCAAPVRLPEDSA